jgi:SET domain-containing protein
MANDKRFRVGRSRTGLGLFATVPIEKGTFIVEYTGRRIPTSEANAREARGSRYMFELDTRWTLDGSSRRNIARYINHACRPNAQAELAGGGRIVIRSITAIRPGDEITYDYGRDYIELFFKRTGCACDTCRRRSRVVRRDSKP